MWERINHGKSGAEVAKRAGVFRKTSPDGAMDLLGEGARLRWLTEHSIPVPHVVECQQQLLVTTEVVGRTFADLWGDSASPVLLDALASMVSRLHALPIESCPFDSRLEILVPQALSRDIDLDDLDDERQGWTLEALRTELRQGQPTGEDLVVAHGDLSFENIVVAPNGREIAGIIDAGRLGVADRWSDLAIICRSLQDDQRDIDGRSATQYFLNRYGVDLDPAKDSYYRLLDEFF